MERNLITRAAEFISEQRKKKRWTKAVTAMAAVVVFCTTYALILPAITQETDVFCGHEAHSHGADCYGQVLTCDLPEAKAHVHSDGCYEVERTLVCTQAETDGHTHTDACRTTETHLACTSQEEGHEHGEGCYTVTSSVTCGQEESSGHTHGDGCWEETRTLVCTESTEIPEGGHVHGPECYGGEELTCGKKEHEHDLICYSDPKADLESASVWERTLPDALTGVWADDLLAVAETQLGYQESTRNYDVDKEGNKLGYTRYGDWYGSPYGHWCAMFVSFCLNYADIPTQAFPWEASCQQWINDLYAEDLYRPAGDYTPKPGDLIFFNWDNEPDSDHVGIVQEVTLDESGAVTQIKTIEGNTSNQVKIKTYLPKDESVMGYGELPENPNPPAESEEEGESEEPEQTEEPEETDEPETPDQTPEEPGEPEPEEPDNGFISLDSLMEQARQADLSNGPVIQIFAQSKEPVSAVFSGRDALRRNVMMYTAQESRASPQSLIGYLDAQEVKGEHSILLMDTNGVVLQPDSNDHYSVTAGTAYRLQLYVKSPNGIQPGSYYYDLPAGVSIKQSSGIMEVTIEGVKQQVGTWSVVTNNGVPRITLDFNSTMNNLSNVDITATMSIVFTKTGEGIPFDGNIYVDVNPEEGGQKDTDLDKYGWQGSKPGEDPGKIYWTIKITGHELSEIPNSIISDSLTTSNHSYTEDDLKRGLSIEAVQKDPKTWHHWNVPFSEPHVKWNADHTTWSYQIPETVYCDWHNNEELTLGSDGWEYSITYTTTPNETDAVGQLVYKNIVAFDGQYAEGWGQYMHGQSTADVIKSGGFQGDEKGGKFVWTIQALIPGRQEGQPADFHWYIWDSMKIKENDTVIYAQNDLTNGSVTATWNGQNYTVPEISQATGDEPFVWYSDYHESQGEVTYGRQISFLAKCACTEDNCQWWNGSCDTCGWYGNRAYCFCWAVEGDTTFTITYETDYDAKTSDSKREHISDYGGSGNILQNAVAFGNFAKDDNGEWNHHQMDEEYADMEIPGMFKKELLRMDDTKYIASYTITVNEAKLSLTEGDSELKIVDTMTETLAYMSGSLVIETEDIAGSKKTLVEGKDYTVEYNSDATETVNGKDTKVRVLTITIMQPGPVMYTLNYDAALVPPSSGPMTYSNSAYVTLWGKMLEADTDTRGVEDFGIAAETYSITIYKTDETSKAPLPGATFGLFYEDGGKIAEGVTKSEGTLFFQTDLSKGIIFRAHTPYYIQEIQAPNGYITDGKKNWFCFCDKGENCPECEKNSVGDYPGVVPVSTGYTFTMTNQLGTYELPETGGAGTNGYTFGGLLLMLGAGFLLYRKTRDGREVKSSS